MIKKMLKILSRSLITTLAILGIIAFGATLFETYIYDYKGSSVVKLTRTYAGRSGGTGFLVKAPNGKLFTLTNAHICRIADKLIAHKQDGDKQEVKVIKIYEKHDLCIMEPVTGLRPLKIAKSIQHHERVWLIGHPSLRALTLESGHFVGTQNIKLSTTCSASELKTYEEKLLKEIEDIEKKILNSKNPGEQIGLSFRLLEIVMELQRVSLGYCIKNMVSQHINNIAYGGNSGSPVVDKFGNVIGVLFAGRGDQPTASFTVPLAEIKKFLEDK